MTHAVDFHLERVERLFPGCPWVLWRSGRHARIQVYRQGRLVHSAVFDCEPLASGHLSLVEAICARSQSAPPSALRAAHSSALRSRLASIAARRN